MHVSVSLLANTIGNRSTTLAVFPGSTRGGISPLLCVNIGLISRLSQKSLLT